MRSGARDKFPLAVSGNSRFLLDGQGSPFYIVGDSPYPLLVDLAPTDNATSSDLGFYLATRKAQGFNTVKCCLIANDQTGGRSDGSTFDGITPFTATTGGAPDLTTPRATYWARMDAAIQLIADYGFLLVLHHIDTQSWLSTMLANGTTRCNTYGQFVRNRYKAFKNIVYLSGNDYQNPDAGGPNDQVVNAVYQGMRAADPSFLHSIQLFFLNSDSFDDSGYWDSRIDLNSVYSYNHQYTYFRTAYGRAPTKPAYLVEATFEHEHNGGTDDSTPILLRAQMYWGLTNGLTGHFYGAAIVWSLSTGWEDELGPPNCPAVPWVTKFITFVASIAWHTLIPDQANTFLTAGQGTNGSLSYATAGKSADGHFGAVYVPAASNLTVNLALMAGAVTARWFDPVAGTFTSAGSGLTGSHVFTHPGNNSGGDPDWLLVLDA